MHGPSRRPGRSPDLLTRTSLFALALGAFSGQAAAQAPATSPPRPPASGEAAAIDEIIVTGTRDANVRARDSVSPVQVVSAAQMQAVAQTDLRDAITLLVPSVEHQPIAGGQGNLTNAIRLRGLGPDQVLVLINGIRRHTTANITVDNAGSGQQGSSAVDLDMIPESAIDHVEVLQDGAAALYGSDAIAGVINIILKSSDRGGDLSAFGGGYYHGDGATGRVAADVGTTLGGEGFLHLSAELNGSDFTNRGGLFTATQTYLSRSIGTPRRVRENVAYDAGRPISDAVEIYSFGTFTHRDGAAYQAPRLGNVAPTIFPNGFSPLLTSDENDLSGTVGLRGRLDAVHYDFSSTYGQDDLNIGLHDSINANLLAATGATPTRFHLSHYRLSQWTNDLNLTHTLDSGLPRPLNIAAGGEYRRETYVLGAGDAASQFGSGSMALAGIQSLNAGTHSRDIYAGYLDLSTKLTDAWRIDLAGRYEHYSDVGSTTTGKISTRYDIARWLAVRGSASTGFRAPTLQQEHYGQFAITLQGIASGLIAIESPAATLLGAPPLRPEESTNYSVGLVSQPITDLYLTADAYQIDIRRRIVTGSTYTGPVAIAAITQAGYTVPGGLSSVSASVFTNGATTLTRGIDLTGSYVTDLGSAGRIHWSLAVNFNSTEVTAIARGLTGKPLLNLPQIAFLTTATPKDRYILGATWTKDRWRVDLQETRYGSTANQVMYYTGPLALSTTQFLYFVNEPKYVTNLDVTYNLTQRLSISAGARNLFNVYPNKLPPNNAFSGAAQWDVNSASIDFNGGFYYTRLDYRF